MTGFEIGLVSVGVILVLIYLGMYVPVALGLVSFVAVWWLRDSVEPSIYLLTLAASNGISNYIFGVIPLFVMMGLLVGKGELGRDIYEVANYGFRRVRGGLGVATVAASAVFSAVTGVSIASAAVFTRISVPEMLRFGYNPRFAVGVVAGSSVLGMLIPPSVILIIYALITEQSVAQLFTAGVIPGLMLALAYSVAIIGMAHYVPNYVGGQDHFENQDEAAPESKLTGREIATKTLPIVVLILLVLGGIYGGVFTPTEAGAVGALGALLISLIKRKLTWKGLWEVLVETGHITASILFLIIAATMYSRMLALSGLPDQLGDFLTGFDANLFVLLALYVIMLIILGTIIDTISIILIMVPLFLPVLAPFDVNLVWFGIVTVFAAEIGLLTPPLGIACYVIKSTLDDDRITLFDIFAGAFPFALIMLAVLILIIAFPSLSLILI